MAEFNIKLLLNGLPLDPLPEKVQNRDQSLPHAPNRAVPLNRDDKKVNWQFNQNLKLNWLFSVSRAPLNSNPHL